MKDELIEKLKTEIQDSVRNDTMSGGTATRLSKIISELEISATQTFIEISPAKGREVCSNCKHFLHWGVVIGDCILEQSIRSQGETCDKFDLTENKEA